MATGAPGLEDRMKLGVDYALCTEDYILVSGEIELVKGKFYEIQDIVGNSIIVQGETDRIWMNTISKHYEDGLYSWPYHLASIGVGTQTHVRKFQVTEVLF